MSEKRVGYWRWLAQVLVGTVRKVPNYICILKDSIYSRDLEISIGGAGTIAFPMFALLAKMTMDTKVILTLCAVPSFLLMMHGIYRLKDDC